ncbi:uncharacterized protein LOC135950503 [Calliphora vicina]|uniref:uncharacterized protein LOC135950503 n=1 Tax=Calliphora vicina TaxID=7373 RepID=UPI00325BC117
MEDSSPIENTNNSHVNHIILPDSTDLDWAQITYALNYKRLMFISSCRTWLNFYTDNFENDKYIDYSPEELCYRFLLRVLANINDYNLTDNELHLLNLLDLHPCFQRTENGFVVVKQIKNLSFPFNEAAIEILLTQGGSLHETNFVAESVNSNDQILITSFKDQNTIQHKFKFNEENAALLSVILSSDDDLPNCELLTIAEIHKRLKTAKNHFEQNGQRLQNINVRVDDLFKKLKAINELKTAVTELVGNSIRK